MIVSFIIVICTVTCGQGYKKLVGENGAKAELDGKDSYSDGGFDVATEHKAKIEPVTVAEFGQEDETSGSRSSDAPGHEKGGQEDETSGSKSSDAPGHEKGDQEDETSGSKSSEAPGHEKGDQEDETSGSKFSDVLGHEKGGQEDETSGSKSSEAPGHEKGGQEDETSGSKSSDAPGHEKDQRGELFYSVPCNCSTILHTHDYVSDQAVSCLPSTTWAGVAVRMCDARKKVLYDYQVLNRCDEGMYNQTLFEDYYAAVNATCCAMCSVVGIRALGSLLSDCIHAAELLEDGI